MIRGTLNYFYTHNREGSEKEEITLKQLANWTSNEYTPQGANYVMTLEFEEGKKANISFLESCVVIRSDGQNLYLFEDFVRIQNTQST